MSLSEANIVQRAPVAACCLAVLWRAPRLAVCIKRCMHGACVLNTELESECTLCTRPAGQAH